MGVVTSLRLQSKFQGSILHVYIIQQNNPIFYERIFQIITLKFGIAHN